MMIKDYKHYDKITTYLRVTNAFKVCKSEMMMVRDYSVKSYKD